MSPLFFAAVGLCCLLLPGASSAPVWKESRTATTQLITHTPHPPPPPPPPPLHLHNSSCLTLITSSEKPPGSSHIPTPKPQAASQHSSLKFPIPSSFNHIPDFGKNPHRLKVEVLSLKDRHTLRKKGTESDGFALRQLAASPKPKLTTFPTTEVPQRSKSKPKSQQIKSRDDKLDKSNTSRTTGKAHTVTPVSNESDWTVNQNKAPSPHLHHAVVKPSSNKRQREGKTKAERKRRKKKKKKQNNRDQTTSANMEPNPPPPSPSPEDDCPSDCVCLASVVECSDRGVYQVPHRIPNNASFISLKNNHISSLGTDLLHDYVSLQFLILSNNWLTDVGLGGVFKGNLALKHLYLDNNLLENVPAFLPEALEELRLDNNYLRELSADSWVQCPFLSVLSLGSNQLGHGSQAFPDGVLSPLLNLRTLNLSHNQLTSAPLGLPPSIMELYLKGNLIKQLHERTFRGMSKLEVLDLSANKLTNKGLSNSLNETHLESLNLEGNNLELVPRNLPSTIKVLNLGSNLIASVKKTAFSRLKRLELLSVARNKVFEVAPGAFRELSFLHQLDFSHNILQQVPRQLPRNMHSVALSNNTIRSVPGDAFCWGNTTQTGSRLAHLELDNNLIDAGTLDPKAFRCLHRNLLVHF